MVAMGGTAFIAHLNAPAFFDETGRDTPKFGLIAGFGFGTSIVLNLVFLFSGFLTFGSASNGMILNSYSHYDVLANVARILFALSVITTYPIVLAGLKPAVIAILQKTIKRIKGNGATLERFKSMKQSALLNQAITIPAIALITLTSILVSDLGSAYSKCRPMFGWACEK